MMTRGWSKHVEVLVFYLLKLYIIILRILLLLYVTENSLVKFSKLQICSGLHEKDVFSIER
jgi:hypothetical protein